MVVLLFPAGLSNTFTGIPSLRRTSISPLRESMSLLSTVSCRSCIRTRPCGQIHRLRFDFLPTVNYGENLMSVRCGLLMRRGQRLLPFSLPLNPALAVLLRSVISDVHQSRPLFRSHRGTLAQPVGHFWALGRGLQPLSSVRTHQHAAEALKKQWVSRAPSLPKPPFPMPLPRGTLVSHTLSHPAACV